MKASRRKRAEANNSKVKWRCGERLLFWQQFSLWPQQRAELGVSHPSNRGIELLYAPLSRLLPKSFQSELQLCNNTKSSIPPHKRGGRVRLSSALMDKIDGLVIFPDALYTMARNPLLIEFPNNYVFYISICLLWAGSSDEIYLFENPIDQGNHFHSTKL